MILSGSGLVSEVSKIHQHGTRHGHMAFGAQQVPQVASAMDEAAGGRWVSQWEVGLPVSVASMPTTTPGSSPTVAVPQEFTRWHRLGVVYAGLTGKLMKMQHEAQPQTQA